MLVAPLIVSTPQRKQRPFRRSDEETSSGLSKAFQPLKGNNGRSDKQLLDHFCPPLFCLIPSKVNMAVPTQEC